jgi:hypothetical protein
VSFVLAYFRLYTRCLREALSGIAKNVWTLVLPIGLFLAFQFLAVPVVGALGGTLGGIVLGLMLDALFSCYLYFTGGVVAQHTVSLKDLKNSFLVYFWSVAGLLFVIWIATWLLGPMLNGMRNGGVIFSGLMLVATVVLNPAPEVIYLKGTRGGLDTVGQCVKFIQENWIEWFIPNGLFVAFWYGFFTRGLAMLPAGLSLVATLIAAMLFHVMMVFRGHLFEELEGSSHRQRMFKYRTVEK